MANSNVTVNYAVFLSYQGVTTIFSCNPGYSLEHDLSDKRICTKSTRWWNGMVMIQGEFQADKWINLSRESSSGLPNFVFFRARRIYQVNHWSG